MGLRRTRDLSHYTIEAIDTDIGSVYDFYFDDQRWTIRYIVVATGTILSGRKVLISPVALLHPAWSPMHIRVNLTWEQVESGPSIDLHKPISRQHEMKHHEHFGLPKYWEGDRTWGSYQNPKELAGAPRTKSKSNEGNAPTETHLRSTREVTGYHIKAIDGEIGHLEDFLFDDESWEIRYAIVDTKNWWPARKVLLRPQWIERVSWTNREIYANISRENIRKSPEWNPDQPISRDYELRLHQHYGYAPYWTKEK
ncbi:MAG: PRC-barrel domain-containing protein [Candidatus Acidiferrales bacterium]